MPMNRRDFVGATLASPLARAEAPAARCRIPDVPVDRLRSFQVCDLLLRVTPAAPDFAPGEVRFTPPEKPFRISLLLPVAAHYRTRSRIVLRRREQPV